MKALCISGFLGLSTDWEILKTSKLDLSCHGPQSFLESPITERADIIIGYSLGGRLALSEFLKPQSSWKKAIIISTHPGLTDEAERHRRIENDKVWARKFLEKPWVELMEEWNHQEVFCNQSLPLTLRREEKHFKRVELAELLTRFSLGKQEDLRPRLRECAKPILFVVGEKDRKFLSLAQEMTALNKRFELLILPNAGHRCLWELDSNSLDFYFTRRLM